MDEEALRSRLTEAELVLGLVEETLPRFLETSPPPAAFVALDLDLYSSTVQALRFFDANCDAMSPRVQCYVDDMTGFSYSDFNGPLLAISEFNSMHDTRKISQIVELRGYVPRRYRDAGWSEKFFLAHIFDHPMYGRYDSLVRSPTADPLEGPG